MRPANTTELKKVNKKNIFFYIYTKKRTTKQDIASSLHLSLPTITQNLRDLEDMDLIQKNGYLESTGGRKANVIMIHTTARVSIGVELLAHSTEIVALDLYGEVLSTREFHMDFANTHDYFRTVCTHINDFIRSLPVSAECILGVGIVLQGLVSADGSLVTYGEILDCTGLRIEEFSQYLPFPCSLFHDAEAAATDELWSYPKISDAIFFHIRTNLSGAIIIDGRFLKGRELKSGIFEHMTIVPDGKPCYCGKKGCIETYCSLNALLREGESLENFFIRLRNDNGPTLKRWKSYLEYLSIAIDNLHMLMDCDIILGGTLAQYLTKEDISLLHSFVQQQSAFPTKRKFIKLSRRAFAPVAIGGALPYISNFLHHAFLED